MSIRRCYMSHLIHHAVPAVLQASYVHQHWIEALSTSSHRKSLLNVLLLGHRPCVVCHNLKPGIPKQVIGDVESFSLVVGPSGEVTHCASGGLRNVKNYPHFNQACK